MIIKASEYKCVSLKTMTATANDALSSENVALNVAKNKSKKRKAKFPTVRKEPSVKGFSWSWQQTVLVIGVVYLIISLAVNTQ